MAGSYEHCTTENGSFIGDRFPSVIEDLDDAREACEHMFWMIQYLANGDKTKIREASIAYYLELDSRS